MYTLSPRMSAAALVVSRLETSDLSKKAKRIGSMLQEMISDLDPVAMELFDSIVLDKSKDDNYLRLWYLRLWQSLDDAGKHLDRPQPWNDEKVIAGKKDTKRTKALSRRHSTLAYRKDKLFILGRSTVYGNGTAPQEVRCYT